MSFPFIPPILMHAVRASDPLQVPSCAPEIIALQQCHDVIWKKFTGQCNPLWDTLEICLAKDKAKRRAENMAKSPTYQRDKERSEHNFQWRMEHPEEWKERTTYTSGEDFVEKNFFPKPKTYRQKDNNNDDNNNNNNTDPK